MMWTQSTAALLLPLLLLLAADSQSAAAASAPNLYADDLSITDSEGKTRHIREFRGKVLLVVNVASQCGFTGGSVGRWALTPPCAHRLLNMWTCCQSHSLRTAFPAINLQGATDASAPPV